MINRERLAELRERKANRKAITELELDEIFDTIESLLDEKEKLIKALKAQMQMRDMKKPTKIEEALSWRDNDDLANKWALAALRPTAEKKEKL